LTFIPSTVLAEEDAVVLFLDKREVQKLCLEHPQIALSALKLMTGRLRKCAELVETLSLRDVDQRLARWLLTEAKSRGTRTNGLLEITLRLTHQPIASRIGSVREVVSRALTRLQQNGLIKVEGRSITITNEAALTSYADD
jgi:CRP-like cAMP-binding protein